MPTCQRMIDTMHSPGLTAVADAAAAIEDAKNALFWEVQDARALHTWQEIADSLGMSRQAAQQRFAASEVG